MLILLIYQVLRQAYPELLRVLSAVSPAPCHLLPYCPALFGMSKLQTVTFDLLSNHMARNDVPPWIASASVSSLGAGTDWLSSSDWLRSVLNRIDNLTKKRWMGHD